MPTSANPSDCRLLPWGLGLLLLLPLWASGVEPDSTRHLFDFSSDRSVVVVDPLLDLAWGPVRPAPAFAWVNVRGATFAASWDEQWAAWGSLEEHQSIRTGADAWWTAMNGSLPGWGRAKLGRDGGQWRTADSLYVDVARAEGGMAWRAPVHSPWAGFSVQASIDRWDWGLENTVWGTVSKTSSTAPAPRAVIRWTTRTSETWCQTNKWVLDERGPLGATSESLFEWTQSLIFGHDRQFGHHLNAGAILGHTRLSGAERLEASGWTKPVKSWWSGVHATWQKNNWWFGTESTAEWTEKIAQDRASHEGIRWLFACGKKGPSGQITLEHLRRPGTPEARALAPADHSLMTHAGLPMGGVWSRATALRWTHKWTKISGFATTFSGCSTEFGDNISVDVIKSFSDDWPICVNVNITQWLSHPLSVLQLRLTWNARQNQRYPHNNKALRTR